MGWSFSLQFFSCVQLLSVLFLSYPLHLLLNPSVVLFYSRSLFCIYWQTPRKSSLSTNLSTHDTIMITIWLGVSNPVLKLWVEVLQITTVVFRVFSCILTFHVLTCAFSLNCSGVYSKLVCAYFDPRKSSRSSAGQPLCKHFLLSCFSPAPLWSG